MAAAAGEHEQVINCDLADKAGVLALAEDVDAIVHLGGISTERAFEEILQANIVGTFHIYEAARKHGIKRVVFASSNHVTGFYPQGEQVDAHSPRRPDCYYGLSKPTAKTWPRSTSTATASKPSACASALHSPNHAMCACCPPG